MMLVPKAKLLGRPTLGGWLTIGNCSFWACVVFAAPLLRLYPPDDVSFRVFFAFALVFSVPVALPLLLPRLDNHPTLSDVLIVSIAIGMNALVWGYGLAWVIRKIAAWLRGEVRYPAPVNRRTSAG